MKMKKIAITISDNISLLNLQVDSSPKDQIFKPQYWIRLLRNHLRMTQAELAKRANITQANLAAIESGKADPRLSTLQRIYNGLSCNLHFEPRPQKPLDEVLRGRARALAFKRLNETMALEEQAPEKEIFKKLLEKRTDEILHDHRERLWRKDHGG